MCNVLHYYCIEMVVSFGIVYLLCIVQPSSFKVLSSNFVKMCVTSYESHWMTRGYKIQASLAF